MRAGWGDYPKEVWIAKLHEDINRWETGHWVNISRVFKLEIGDIIETIEDVEDASEH